MPTTILVVDDDTDYVDLTTMILRKDGYQVATASDGSVALEELKKHQPEVVLVDWNMPGMNGINFIKSVKMDAQYCDRYVIMVTARSDPQAKAEGMNAGADDYLTKPFDNLELLARVHVGLRTRNLQKALADKVRTLDRAVEQSPVSIVITDTHGTIEYVNRHFSQLTGYSFNEAIGKNPRVLKSGETPSEEYAQLWNRITSGGEWRGEFHNKKKNGELYWEHASISPIKNEKGDISHFLAVKEDITKRRQADQEQRESEERYRSLFENMLNGFAYCKMLFDQGQPHDFLYLNVNRAFQTLTGLKNVVGKRVSEVIPGIRESDPELLEIYGRVALTGNPEKFETYVHGLDMWFSISVYCPRREYFVAVFDVITERKRAEIALSAERNKLRTLIDNLPDRIFVKDNQSRFVVNNVAHMKALGAKTHEEIIGKTDFDYRPEHIAAKSFKGDRHVIESGEPLVDREELSVLPSGDTRWLLVTKVPLRDHNGVVTGLVGISRDITDRKRAEEAIRQSELQFRLVWEKSADGMRLIDGLGTVLKVNEAFCRMVGKPREAIEGKPLSIIYAEEQQEHILRRNQERFLSRTISPHLERELTLWNGKKVWFEATNSFFEAEGQTQLLLSIFRDITERKRAEEALKLFRTLVDRSNDAIEVLDPETGRFLDINEKACMDLGYSREEFLALSVFDIDPTLDKSHFTRSGEELRQSSAMLWEGVHRRKDGSTFPVEVNIKYIQLDRGYIVTAVRDITERKRAEEERQSLERQVRQRNVELEETLAEIKQMQASLVQSEKMASIGQLTAGIAHEINNPLAFVSSNLNRFNEYFDDTLSLLKQWQEFGKGLDENPLWQPQLSLLKSAEQQADIDFITEDFGNLMRHSTNGAERIKSIVDRLRGFSHLAGTEFADANINEALDDTLTIAWNELKYKASINKDYAALPPVRCNIGEIKQVFLNLMVNAAHAIQEKAEITLRTFQEGKTVTIQISDTGSGIAPENLRKIFDPFFTTKPVGKGTGLGLWISTTIIQKHQGTIAVESELGRGTTFTIKLPIEQEEKLEEV